MERREAADYFLHATVEKSLVTPSDARKDTHEYHQSIEVEIRYPEQSPCSPHHMTG
jgi:hypothetical protein